MAEEKEYNTALRLQQWMDENDATQADILRRCEHYSKKYNIDISKSSCPSSIHKGLRAYL